MVALLSAVGRSEVQRVAESIHAVRQHDDDVCIRIDRAHRLLCTRQRLERTRRRTVTLVISSWRDVECHGWNAALIVGDESGEAARWHQQKGNQSARCK